MCVSRPQTFVPIFWMCKKQTAVSSNSAESACTSLDAGSEMESIPALQLWDCVFETFSPSITAEHSTSPSGKRHSLSTDTDHFSFDSIDHVSSNIPESSCPARLHFRGHRSSHPYYHQGLQFHFVTRVTNPLELAFRTRQSGKFYSNTIWCVPQNSLQTRTKGALTTVPWTSLIQLFDMNQPPELNVDRSFFRIILFCGVSTNPSRDT